ncbi:glycosyl transferase [Smithella sp. ME-1]|uniref:Glycosyltransferase n=1 Tax=hydrocarbon metagenome TaxID=938273 RepID=A0A0W8FV75_9ZZZZ|nr:glycosyl transferase [Smithella sp. ME-1]
MHKIAVIIPKYGLIGGAEQYSSELTGRLASSTEYDFHVYANRWKESSIPINFHKTPIVSFPKFLTTPGFAYFAGRSINVSNYSLIHSHERIFDADIFTLHGIPHRYWVHNIRQKHMSLFDSATAWVEKKMVYESRCKKFVAVSSLTKDIFLQKYEIENEKVDVINPGVDLNDFRLQNKNSACSNIRRELGINSTDPVIIFAAMNFEIKGLDDILFSLAKLKAQNRKFKLVVVGKGNVKKYKKLAEEAKIISDVIFTGQLNKEKLINVYLAGNIFMILSRFDTFGMVVLEAMAAGLPVIISRNVGAKDIVREDKNGFIVGNTSDADYIAAKISLLLDENIRQKMSEAARQTAAQNTWDNVTNKYAAIYENIIKEKKILN